MTAKTQKKMAFQFTPLPNAKSWIRLFRIISPQPFDEDAAPALQCHTEAFELANTPASFMALSYEWGPNTADNHASITVNGDGSLRIRKTLYKFLQRICGAEEHVWSGWFFADAICLNQADEAEKDAQVPLMGQIYTEAEVVHCWLGEPTSKDENLLYCLSSGESCTTREEASLAMREKFIWLFQQYQDSTVVTPLDPDDRTNLIFRMNVISWMRDFVRKSYWTRLWMVQELILPQSLVLYCGGYKFSWPQLEHWLPRYLGSSSDSILDLFGAFNDENAVSFSRVQPPWEKEWRESVHGKVGKLIQWRQREDEYPPSLYEAIDEFGFSKCERPRDRVYGLLGLAIKDSPRHPFPVNNHKPIVEVFYDTLVHCKDDATGHNYLFAKKLWAVLGLPLSVVLDARDGYLPQATRSAIPTSISVSFPISLEQEIFVSGPTPRGFFGRPSSGMKTFELKAPSDLTGRSINDIIRMTIASVYSTVSAYSFDDVRRDDLFLSIRGTSCGVLYDSRTRRLKGTFVMARKVNKANATDLARTRLKWCQHLVMAPSLEEQPNMRPRARARLCSAPDLLILAADVDGNTFDGNELPEGFGI